MIGPESGESFADSNRRSMQYGLLQRWAAVTGLWWAPPEGLGIPLLSQYGRLTLLTGALVGRTVTDRGTAAQTKRTARWSTGWDWSNSTGWGECPPTSGVEALGQCGQELD